MVSETNTLELQIILAKNFFLKSYIGFSFLSLLYFPMDLFIPQLPKL